MPTYEMQAPNGRTYRIPGPAGATDDQIRAKILEQHPDAAKPASAGGAKQAPPETSFLDDLGQYAGVATRALAPYATAAGAGALAGAPVGGVGAIPGAAGGALALGLSDLGTLGYNAAASLFGGDRAPLPSQTIQNAYEKAGIGRRPETPTQQVFSDVVEGTAGALAPANAFGTLAPKVTGTTQRVFNVLAEQPKAQAMAGAFGAAAPSAAANYGEVTDPLALTSLGFAGGFLGGKPGVKTPKGPSVDQLRANADAAYKRANAAGMVFPNQNFATLTTDIGADLAKQGFNRRLHPKVAAVLGQFNQEIKSGNDFGLDNLDVLRRVAKSAAGSFDRDERRLGRIIVQRIDDFIMNPKNVSEGTSPDGAFALKQARELWSRKAHVEAFDDAVQAAYNRTQTGENPPSMGQALRGEFGKIVNNPRRLKGFTSEEQGYIREIAGGKPSSKALLFAGNLLTPNSIRGLAAEAGIASSMLPFLGPQGIAVALGTSLIGAGAKGRVNAMTVRAAERARNAMATGETPPPRRNFVLMPATAAAARAPSRGEEANKLRQQYKLPAWAVPPK